MMLPFVLYLVQAQGETTPNKPVHPGHKAAAATEDKRPITAREAGQAFDRLAGLFQKVNGVALGATTLPTSDRLATRSEIVAEMGRLMKAAAPTIRFTPAPVRHDPSVFRIDAAQRATLDRLVTLGFVARIGPLVVGPSPNLTPHEFGDALGFFMARLAQVSHLPSPKWTPMLEQN